MVDLREIVRSASWADDTRGAVLLLETDWQGYEKGHLYVPMEDVTESRSLVEATSRCVGYRWSNSIGTDRQTLGHPGDFNNVAGAGSLAAETPVCALTPAADRKGLCSLNTVCETHTDCRFPAPRSRVNQG